MGSSRLGKPPGSGILPHSLDEFDPIAERVAELEAIEARDRDRLDHLDPGRRQEVAPASIPATA